MIFIITILPDPINLDSAACIVNLLDEKYFPVDERVTDAKNQKTLEKESETILPIKQNIAAEASSFENQLEESIEIQTIVALNKGDIVQLLANQKQIWPIKNK
uniref:Uncharacterized protein n=1 Tax=Romanomermis culicivorax TaxID=13658 RepID=A0A915HT43_ROMCU